ncbi:glycosyltransferase [Candidatus Izemoplasma sp. B36]|uniref:glycosyltransferase n=1 Tax=Candidatus Izemoplasma sp. B36 TaxID=3242468 RepID=UPI003558126D
MNILVLTSIYPQYDDVSNSGVTPVVKYFVEEWIKLDNKVVVIHNLTTYPRILYLLPRFVRNKINSRYGIVIPNKGQSKKIHISKEKCEIYRLPLKKIIPKSLFSIKKVKNQFDKIISILKSLEFNPDLILGHWENPQILLIPMIKKIYPNAITSLVLHGIVYLSQEKYKNLLNEYLSTFDIIGARSEKILLNLKNNYNIQLPTFICYSGINDKYFEETQNLEFYKIENSYLFVGRLIQRKNIDVPMRVLKRIYNHEKFEYNIIGIGSEMVYLRNLSKSLNISENVIFYGYMSRNSILEFMKKIEVFIMISNYETFGLVYLEAMSRGCIVIASKEGGMDGIIINGYNGYLCKQGDEIELESIINKIRDMSLKKKHAMQQNAIKTAQRFKDSKVAKNYLKNVSKVNSIK